MAHSPKNNQDRSGRAAHRSGPRSAALRCPRAGRRAEAEAFVSFLMVRLRETVNQSRPRSQLLGLCAASAKADLAALMSELPARQLITHVATHAFELEGQESVHDFVCRFDCRRDQVRVLLGRVQRGAEGWRVVSLHQLPTGFRGRSTV
ncbi:hypothetical protein [Segniliparus rugosus]|nr:hypothetical protein [Segniliparus rugosus]